MRTIDEVKHFFDTQVCSSLQELERERKRAVREYRDAYLISTAVAFGIILVLFFLNILSWRMMVWAVLIGFLLEGVVYITIQERYRPHFKEVVIVPMIAFVDERLRYDISGRIDQKDYEDSKIFLQRVDSYWGDDFVEGVLGHTRIRFCELHTEHLFDFPPFYQKNEIFHGMFFTADFNKHFQGRTVVLPDQAEKTLGGLGQFFQSKNFFRDPLVRMDDPVFEKEFVVYGTDQIEARYILTSSLMKRIMDFRQKTGRQIYLSFVDSNIFIAIPYTKNLFEPTVFQTLLNFSVIKEYFIDLKTALDIVDELNLNTRIWTKE